MASVSLPPPVGGLDQRESLADMPADHAVVLDNFFPDTDRVSIRRGNSSFATGMTGNVETLIEYTPQTGTGELFAANAGKIYDVSAAGAVGRRTTAGNIRSLATLPVILCGCSMALTRHSFTTDRHG